MSRLHSIQSELQTREADLAESIARLADLLRPVPSNRDQAALRAQYRALTLTRRSLVEFVKDAQRGVAQDRAAEVGHKRLWHTVQKSLSSTQKRLRVWGRFDAIVMAQIEATPSDLLQDHARQRTGVEVMDHVVNRCLDALHRTANPIAHTQSDAAEDRGLHRDIPLSMMQFSKMLGAAHRLCLAQRKTTPMRFLDVGSGGGTKVLAASTCFDHCDGLEYEAATVETGAAFLGFVAPPGCRLIHGDALQFSDYAAYDVIYFYRPLVSEPDMIALETRILEQARPGTVLLAAGRSMVSEIAARDAFEVVPSVYVTGLSPAESVRLQDNAARIGPMVPGHDRRAPPNLGYWDPLREVSAQNGYWL